MMPDVADVEMEPPKGSETAELHSTCAKTLQPTPSNSAPPYKLHFKAYKMQYCSAYMSTEVFMV